MFALKSFILKNDQNCFLIFHYFEIKFTSMTKNIFLKFSES